MKFRFKLIGTVIALGALMIVAAPVMATPPSPVIGHWTAPDTYDNDGSITHMIISPLPNGVFKLHGFDNPATSACPTTAGMGLLDGTATFDGTTITKTVVASCPSEGITYPEATLTMTYDPTTDTIYDPTFNLTYSRGAISDH
jgi:hypothetical protein